MAKHKDFTKKYNPTKLNGDAEWGSFNNEPGSLIEGFLKSLLEDSVVDFNYVANDANDPNGNFTLYGLNAFGEAVCSTKVVNADPSYSADFSFINLTVGNKTYIGSDTAIQINKSGDLNVNTTFKFVVTGNIAGNVFNDTSAYTVTFGWYEDSNCEKLDRILPVQTYTINPGETITKSLNNLFEYAFTNRYLGIEFSTKTLTGIQTQKIAFGSRITLKALILSYSGEYLLRSNTITNLTLDGLDSNENVSDYYYTYYLDDTTSQHAPLSGTNSSLNLTLDGLSEGVHNLFIKVQNSENDNEATLVSNDLLIGFIYQKEADSTITTATALVTAVPDYINNCDTSTLFRVVTTDLMQGNIRILILKSSKLGDIATIKTIEQALASNHVFKDVTLNLSITDKSINTPYNSYIEVTQEAAEYLKVLTSNGEETLESKFYVRSNVNTVNLVAYKTIEVINPKNGISHLVSVKGSILDFSQINNGNVFTGLNPNMDEADGFLLETENNTSLSVFKVSPISNVFSEPKKLLSSGGTSLNKGAFSIEMVIKTYNCTDLDDEIVSIGNIKLCPKHLFVYKEGEILNRIDPKLVRNASRADFLKNKKLHITITFDPAYKPSTYETIYNSLLSVNDEVSYSKDAVAYPCLKIYIDGTINRTIRLDSADLESDGFNLQIHPSKSNINFYAFKTYDKALTYSEIRLNVISQMLKLSEKEAYYELNDILYNSDDFAAGHDKLHLIGTISLGKCLNKFKSVGNPKQYINRRVLLLALPEGVLPPYYGNRKNTESVATFLVNYPDDKKHSGRLQPKNIEGGEGTVKAQGSSAKKYFIHNTSYSKFKFISEELWNEDNPEATSYYKMPGDEIEIKKLVGKVNYASSMQSHKLGATKLFHDGYIASKLNTDWMNGGRKAVLEDDFFYFYVNVPKEDLTKLTWDYFKKDGEYNFENCYFLGFLTWGSAKGDDATSGYDDNTPYYVMLEGADNANAAANFKVPWAAMQCWKDPSNVNSEFEQFSGKDSEGNMDYLTNMLIEDETIVYNPGVESENSTDKRADAWDVDFGSTKSPSFIKKDNEVYEFEEKAKVSLNRFAEFYNLIYKYDFSSLVFIPNNTTIILDSELGIESNEKLIYSGHDKKIVFGDGCFVRLKDSSTTMSVNPGDIYRWEKRWADEVTNAPTKSKWVPAGLTYTNGVWDTLNIYDLCNEYALAKTGFFALPEYNTLRASSGESSYEYYRGNLTDPEEYKHSPYVENPNYWDLYIKILAEAFKIIVHEYTDIKDIAYHLAFIKLIAGTDNRAKNTYFQIVGPIGTDDTYEINEENLRKDFKIRLYQDDLDTIFKTDNNGQQIKPYNMLEPMFDAENADLWGDLHSGFFYNLDLVFSKEIKTALALLLDFATQDTWPDSETSRFYKYFLSVLKGIPSIAYNHQSEIYYESAETLRLGGKNTAFYTSLLNSSNNKNWKDYSNNQVNDPLSLSHGSCYDAEVEYLRERVLMLSTYTKTGKYNTGESISWAGGSHTSSSTYYDLKLNYTSFIQHIYPIILGIQLTKDTTYLKYDPIIDKLYKPTADNKLYDSALGVVRYMAVPDEEHLLSLGVSMSSLTGTVKWENTDLYKTIAIETGLSNVMLFLNFPNANTVICTDSLYSISTGASELIVVSNYMPSVEHLILQNAQIKTLGLDFSNCNRLKTLILGKTLNDKTDDTEITSDTEYYALKIEDVLNPTKEIAILGNEGSSGFSQVVLPNSNILQLLNLPKCVKTLNMGYYPNLSLSNLKFEEGTAITNLVIDGRNSIAILNYILSRYVSTQNSSVYIINVPEGGIWLSEQTCNVITKLNTLKVDGYINIGSAKGDKTAITFNTKKALVDRFGDIDSVSNNVHFKYTTKNVTSVLAANTATIQSSGYAPVNLQIDGNNVPIENEKLKVYYKILPLYTSDSINSENISINTNTGYLTIKEGHEGTYSIETTVYYNTTSKAVLSTKLTVGFYRPVMGDFAYSNGTFSSTYDPNLGLVGVVYYSKYISTTKQEVRVLSNDYISNVIGPCKVLVGNDDIYGGGKKDSLEAMLSFLQTLLPEDYNTYYTDTRDTEYLTNLPSPITYLSKDIDLPADVPDNLRKYLERINTYTQALNSINSSLNLPSLNTDSVSETDIQNYNTIYNTLVGISNMSIGGSGDFGNLSLVLCLYPAIVKTLYYSPENLVGKGSEYFGLGKWYVPTCEELTLLIKHRIISSMKNKTNTEKCWNAIDYSNAVISDITRNFGPEVFSNIHFFRNSSNILALECNLDSGESETGNSYYYGTPYYGDNPGWYIADVYGGQSSGFRDSTQTLYPCCRVTLTKS